MLSQPNIVLVVDIRNWAFDKISQNIVYRLSSLYRFEILYWEDFSDSVRFIREINSRNPDIVHFFFREQLSLILETVNKDAKYFVDFCSRVITTHIPDYLFDDAISMLDRKVILDFVDGYFTTNQALFDIYKAYDFIPDPHSVIHDWVKLSPPDRTLRAKDRKIRIFWSGNSIWGEYVGHVDYKGLNTIIRPAIAELEQNYTNFEFICFDAATGKTPHEEVLELLSRSDILLIASQKEGTPLTLIEAMAHKCAVVSTKVGIAPEILPPQQQEFIVDRSPRAFAEKLEKLLCDPALIAQLGEQNYQVWRRLDGEEGPLVGKWHSFFSDVLERYRIEGPSRKLSVLPKQSNRLRRFVVSTARSGGRMANRMGFVSALNRISPKFGAIYHNIVHGGDRRRVNYSKLEPIYAKKLLDLTSTDPLVIYAAMWKGVSASTEAIFPLNCLQFPFTDSEYPEVDTHEYLEKMSEQIAVCASKVVIYSGGSRIHQALARKVKALNAQKRQYFMWHGSPAQWVDAEQLNFFHAWSDEYGRETISGIITLKSGLDQTLRAMGIPAWSIFNPVPHIDDDRPSRELDARAIRVGIFSAISSWYKNPFPQLLSLAGRQDIQLTTNLDKTDVAAALPGLAGIEFIHHMSRLDFLAILGRQNLNLYVTNTECSPMIALESWACLVPCIVGPAGDVYSAVCPILGEWLVEKRVDDADAISRRIDHIMKNYDLVVGLLKLNRSKQREQFADARIRLIENL